MYKFQIHLEDGTVIHARAENWGNLLSNYLKHYYKQVQFNNSVSPIKKIMVYIIDSKNLGGWREADVFSIRQCPAK